MIAYDQLKHHTILELVIKAYCLPTQTPCDSRVGH